MPLRMHLVTSQSRRNTRARCRQRTPQPPLDVMRHSLHCRRPAWTRLSSKAQMSKFLRYSAPPDVTRIPGNARRAFAPASPTLPHNVTSPELTSRALVSSQWPVSSTKTFGTMSALPPSAAALAAEVARAVLTCSARLTPSAPLWRTISGLATAAALAGTATAAVDLLPPPLPPAPPVRVDPAACTGDRAASVLGPPGPLQPLHSKPGGAATANVGVAAAAAPAAAATAAAAADGRGAAGHPAAGNTLAAAGSNAAGGADATNLAIPSASTDTSTDGELPELEAAPNPTLMLANFGNTGAADPEHEEPLKESAASACPPTACRCCNGARPAAAMPVGFSPWGCEKSGSNLSAAHGNTPWSGTRCPC
mmetsp:Transcript_54271/g.137910  ORF Transcript_54271/g.137910 Transcript_54271/m.137910 type:complete len:366 (+) Transcript_54271:396-1493(+)